MTILIVYPTLMPFVVCTSAQAFKSFLGVGSFSRFLKPLNQKVLVSLLRGEVDKLQLNLIKFK